MIKLLIAILLISLNYTFTSEITKTNQASEEESGKTSLVQTATAIATSYMGGFGMFAAPGASTSSLLANAALTSAASKGMVSLANNKFDLSKSAKETFSKDSIKSIGINVATSGLVHHISDLTGLGALNPDMDLASRAGVISQQTMIQAGVGVGLSGISGEKVESILKKEALSGLLAGSQSIVGDVASKYNMGDSIAGKIGKMGMHASLGSGYSAALGGNALSGAIGGMVPEIVPELMSGADSTTIKSASKLTSGAASLMLGGKASDVNNAALISASSIEHNRRLHPEEQVILEQLQRGKTKEEQAKLAAAVAARIRAADGVEDSDPDKARLLAMQEQGADYAAESRQLDEALKAAEALGKGPLFEYTATDKIQDFISRNDEHVSRAIGGIKTGVGAVGAIVSAGGATTGLGSAVAAVTGPLSAMYAKEGYEQAFGNYNSSEGKKVIESFNSSTPSYGEELGAKLATETATTIAGATIMKTAGMTLTHIAPTLQKLASTTANIKQKAKTFKSTAVKAKDLHQPKMIEGFTPKKEQPWVIREGQEYKLKIIGKAQKSTPGHDVRSYREAIKAAKRNDVEKAYLNRGMNKVTGSKKGDPYYMKPNRRPDVTIKRKDGKIDQIEVPSKTDRPEDLLERMEETWFKLPEHMRGKFRNEYIKNK